MNMKYEYEINMKYETQYFYIQYVCMIHVLDLLRTVFKLLLYLLLRRTSTNLYELIPGLILYVQHTLHKYRDVKIPAFPVLLNQLQFHLRIVPEKAHVDWNGMHQFGKIDRRWALQINPGLSQRRAHRRHLIFAFLEEFSQQGQRTGHVHFPRVLPILLQENLRSLTQEYVRPLKVGDRELAAVLARIGARQELEMRRLVVRLLARVFFVELVNSALVLGKVVESG